MTEQQRTGRSYDTVADRYGSEVGDELRHKPFDRALLEVLVETAGTGLVADVGCGPGHVAAHLRERGARVVAVDLSPRMAGHAHASGTPAVAGDLTALPFGDGALAGLICFYAVFHLDDAGRRAAYAEMARVLRPGARAIVAFHTRDADSATGTERRMHEWWDHDVDLTFRFLSPDDELARLTGAGLKQVARLERQPGPGEHPSVRGYLVVERPGG
jgi:SAM-dependent methyltransferase